MKIYLVQHGESLDKEMDPQQSLSPKGINDIEKLGQYLDYSKTEIDHIFHSGKRRAEQSASILASHFSSLMESEIHPGLNPLDDVNPIVSEINQQQKDIMLVGHMPFLGKLVSKLVVLDEEKSLVAFVPGTITCLERTDAGKWQINWIRRPDK
ncbi:phosphohistidine phosphatase SixA [Fluoribacter dumoffii]|uniref:phosphohistidine phosphatase SixA n=1 Tax=Fluoribacter dumoffii TaxID=463 RepID=UPI0022434827|nr:phosphohistidine phosphatase SixA [Fluoribacter dumoffii]MCW8419276.1 phosphohistidine phosphatase SixA [Fluoribacter dumoffii]MCW8452849.1 phosphohistidine phosphatase SixA [Fluoribacter dumoffii]MCW8459901.1 phosphohistidine phosphatase SixA [Fluoribacter dumoffii]MCW8483378.1 phosphohistidine phosphatase SixA [Fluoribacter dumoffii]